MSAVGSWIKDNPVLAGVAIVVGGGALFLLLKGGGSSSANSSAAAAYYAAQSAQAQSGNALQAIQIQAQAQTAQTLIAAQTKLASDNIWAPVAIQESNNSVAISANAGTAATQQDLIGALGQTASLPGATVTSTSHSSGFFGIGGGSSSTTSYVPNPAAVQAATGLSSLFSQWFGTGTQVATH